MRVYLQLALLFSVVFAGPEIYETNDENLTYFLVERSDGEYVIEDLVNSRIETRASRSDVTYHFYTRQNPNSPVDLKNTDVNQLRNTAFDPNKETMFIVHGWSNHHLSPVNNHIREAILARHDVNVFVVDWSPIADRNYLTAKNAVGKIGTYVGEFIQSVSQLFNNIPLARFTLAGHSLGAHISGNAGMHLNGAVGHIIGMDPAGPLFSSKDINNRIDPTDGQYVQIIHTNSLLGYTDSCGHADYFPNGGKSQPGCGIDLAGSCAHSRAYKFYAESVLSNLFVSTACNSYSDFNKGRCSTNPTSRMGGFAGSSDRLHGDYYLKTNSGSPYAQG